MTTTTTTEATTTTTTEAETTTTTTTTEAYTTTAMKPEGALFYVFVEKIETVTVAMNQESEKDSVSKRNAVARYLVEKERQSTDIVLTGFCLVSISTVISNFKPCRFVHLLCTGVWSN